ncbi:MAG TPA: DUF4382 domain-containing protein [Gammaproteobacteria bacterium]|nr:DUF4382 domain-containing protein [Gammaproteobacteria bacterium]
MKILRCVFAFILLCTLAGCNDSSDGTAALNLYIADTPVDNATSVNIVFTGVEIQPADNGSMDMMDMGSTAPIEYDFATPQQIDLMAQQGGNSAVLLNGLALSAGSYQWIRLMVDASQSSITLRDGTLHPLTIPSGAQTGLKLVNGFVLAAGDTANFTIDFNLRQSITLANGVYILKPALRLIDNQQVGSLRGSVSSSFVIGATPVSDPACSPAVYIYSGAAVSPVDINTTSPVQPITTASVKLDNVTGAYTYAEAFLAPGDYTLAMVCAAGDDPTIADTLDFSAAKAATIVANQTATVDFP